MSSLSPDRNAAIAGAGSPNRPPQGELPHPREGREEAGTIRLPEKLASERWIAFLLFVLSCAYLCLFTRYTTIDPDEGIVLQGAQRILQGQVLYRDFFSFFTPGSYYLLALLFKIFGSSILIGRSALVIYGGLFSALTYLLARRVCSRWSAVTAACLVGLIALPYRFLVLHNWDSTLWAYLALYCAVWFLQLPQSVWAVGIGFFSALTFLFEQSKGAGLMLGLGVGGLLIVFGGRRGEPFQSRHVVALMAGFASPFLATLAFFAAWHSLSLMLHDWFWPVYHYHGMNSVPFAYQNWSDHTREVLAGDSSWFQWVVSALVISPCFIMPVLPILALGGLAYWAVEAFRSKRPVELSSYYILVCAGLSGLLLSIVIARADIVHVMYLAPPFCLVLAWILDGKYLRSGLLPWIRPALNIFLTVSFAALGMALLLTALSAHRTVVTRRGTLRTGAPDTVIEYIQAWVPDGQKIFVYPYLPLYYYLTRTASPTRYEYLQPGMHTPQQSEEALRQLISDRTRVVLLELSFAEKIPTSWPSTPVRFIANDPLADYVLQHYRGCRILRSPQGWRFLFMIRNDLVCPGVFASD